MANLGALHDGRTWALPSEMGRWCATLLTVPLLAFVGFPLLAVGIAGVGIVSVPWVRWAVRQSAAQPVMG